MLWFGVAHSVRGKRCTVHGCDWALACYEAVAVAGAVSRRAGDVFVIAALHAVL